MKRKLLTILSLILLFLCSCNNAKQDGIYKTENGWDIVEEGKTYSYCCEPDGLYLYIDWEGNNHYVLEFWYRDEIFRKTVGHTSDFSSTTLKFLCKNKNGKYVYVAEWYEFDGCFYNLEKIEFPIGEGRQLILNYSEWKEMFNLMEKYISKFSF